MINIMTAIRDALQTGNFASCLFDINAIMQSICAGHQTELNRLEGLRIQLEADLNNLQSTYASVNAQLLQMTQERDKERARADQEKARADALELQV